MSWQENKAEGNSISEDKRVPSAANLGSVPDKTLVPYVIDAAASKFSVHVSTSGWLAVFGHNLDIAIRNFEGEVHLDSESIESSSLLLRMDASSLAVVSKTSDHDRIEIERTMQDQILNASGYPEIIYESTHAKVSAMSNDRYWMALNGELTLRDTKRPLSVSCSVILAGTGLRATGEFTLVQTQFGIKPISVMGGGLQVKDELKFKFDVVAKKG